MSRQDSVGHLAGAMAHDFNNVLLAVLGNIDLALVDLESDPDATRQALEQTRQAALRGSKLTRRLLTFASRHETARGLVDVQGLLDELLPLLRRLIPERVTLERGELAAAQTLADAAQLEQVLMNLVVNARDAIEEHGHIRLSSRLEVIDAARVRPHPWARPGRYVAVRVEDDGCGIPADLHERIFDPFFTTKALGSGTGLGLSIVYGVVQRHDGFIEVDSEEGEGTRFDVFLPLHEGTSAPDVTPLPVLQMRGGTERVLVAEDEAPVRNLACRMLERAGYEVQLAENGRVAVERFLEAPESFDVVLLDVVMPGLSGAQVFHEIRARRPELPVIFSSGYSAGELEPDILGQPRCYALGKPYDRAQLLGTVRAALDEALQSERK